MIGSDEIRALEERAFNAWPPLRSVIMNGWQLRLSGGYTKRANSVNAFAPRAAFRDVREAAEALYARHGLPTIFRLTPLAPQDADRALEAAGYASLDPNLVLTAPAASMNARGAVQIEDAPSPGWLAGFAAVGGVGHAQRAIHDAMVSAIALPRAFATIHEGAEPAGFGLAVYERGAVGLFDIAIDPSRRGRGHGRTLTSALIAWGGERGAEQAYLQVGAHNAGARGLYASLGFREAYRYHYRRRDS